jgi:hypothetical protein
LGALIEGLSIQQLRVRRRLSKTPSVVFAAQPEVREVVKETTENGVAVLGVLHGVKDVTMPELIDLLGRYNGNPAVLKVQLQEPTVLDVNGFRLGA